MSESDYLARIAVLEAENVELRVQCSSIPLLKLENETLQQRVLDLEQMVLDLMNKIEQLSIRNDSRNSSKPPSSDFGRKNKTLRKSSGRKPGAHPIWP